MEWEEIMDIDNYMAMGVEDFFYEKERDDQADDVVCPDCQQREGILPAESYCEHDYECLCCGAKIYRRDL
jgi:hypothetical protein